MMPSLAKSFTNDRLTRPQTSEEKDLALTSPTRIQIHGLIIFRLTLSKKDKTSLDYKRSDWRGWLRLMFFSILKDSVA